MGVHDERLGRCNVSTSQKSAGQDDSLTHLLDTSLPQGLLWDLVDMDIQGSELEIISNELPSLTSRVRRLHVSTHSRAIHIAVLDNLRAEGWSILREFPPLAVNRWPLYGRCSEVLVALMIVLAMDVVHHSRETFNCRGS
mmetsp:Transcript_72704/g.236077  ORF Transcript_72704/g.236077 Transcript_72704/m.236077 type:complete len:140 (+) Transcript_72704:215-634(+)